MDTLRQTHVVGQEARNIFKRSTCLYIIANIDILLGSSNHMFGEPWFSQNSGYRTARATFPGHTGFQHSATAIEHDGLLGRRDFPFVAGEPSPALPVRTRESSARPALSRLSRASSGSAARQVDHSPALHSTTKNSDSDPFLSPNHSNSKPTTLRRNQGQLEDETKTLINPPGPALFVTRGPAPSLRPFPPPRSQPRPPSSLTQKPLEGGVPSRSRLRPALRGVRVSSRKGTLAASPAGPPQPRGKQEKGGKPARTIVGSFFSTGHTPAFSDLFQRGKARSVARGGWRPECREWW